MAKTYYRENTKLLKSLDDFDHNYQKNEVLQWCFSSPFPSRFLYYALSSRNFEYIELCRFLITDLSRVLQSQSMNYAANGQFYRGMKVTNEGLEKLIKHTGKLICPNLRPVLFKISGSSSVPTGQGTAGLVVFDVYTTFRVKYINCGPVSIVKLELADEIGRNLARKYRMKYKSENILSLLDQFSALAKPPARLSPVRQLSLPLTNVTSKMTAEKVR
jgi:hypothetical protein